MSILPIPQNLKVCGSAPALSLDRKALTFSWEIPTTMMQYAYRLTFAGSMADLKAERYIHDTGFCASPISAGVVVEGLSDKLLEGHAYVWQVSYMASPAMDYPFVSAPATFTIAPKLVSPHGLWSPAVDGKHDYFMFARHEFDIPTALWENTTLAVLTVTATSPEEARQYVYLGYLDGECVGVGPTRYGKNASGDTILYYQSYNLTPLLSEGKHCLSLIAYSLASPSLFCQLTLFDNEGAPFVLCDSGRDMALWRTLGGDRVYRPDTSIGTHYYVAHANHVDATCYPHDFGMVGFDDSLWTLPDDRGDLSADMQLLPCPSAPMRRFAVSPKQISIKTTPEGDYLVDIGREIVGGLKLYLPHCPEADVTLLYGEELTDPHHVKYQMRTGNTYREVWRTSPHATYIENISMMTYRYVQITGLPVELTPEMVIPLELRGDFDPRVSNFESSSALLEDIYALVKHTIKVTTQDLYVDAQSRERMAYEGDLIINQLSAYAFCQDLRVPRFTVEYLITHRTWPAEYPLFTVMGAWLDYMASRDGHLLATYYPQLCGLVTRFVPDVEVGLVPNVTTASSQIDGVLVDWPMAERDGYHMDTTYNTVFNACLVGAYGALSKIAQVVGQADDAKRFASIKNSLISRMTELLYDPARGCFLDGCDSTTAISPHASQHATAFALAFDVYQDPSMACAMANFLGSTERIRMSVYGAFFLLAGLYRAGAGDLANQLLLSEDTSEGAHTWAAMLSTVGATITTEAWHPTGKPNMTHAHPWGSAPAHLIMSGIFGITPTSPGYSTFDIRLQPQGIPHAAIILPCVKGQIHVDYTQSHMGMAVTLTIPGNATATLYIPAVGDVCVMQDGMTLPPHGYTYRDGYVAVTLPSGFYEICVGCEDTLLDTDTF